MSTAVIWLGTVLAAAAIVNNNGLTVSEAGSANILSDTLKTEDSAAPGAVFTYTLVTTPVNGSLRLNGTTLNPNDQFNQSDVNNSLLDYMHNDSETLSDSFDFIVESITDTLPQATFLITVTPIFDQTPIVSDQEFNVDENSTVGTAVGTILATDADAGDALAYSILDGNTGTAFEVGSINTTDAAITVANTAPLDFETNQNITFTVQVEDMGALTDTAVITVSINDINEAPIITGTTFSIPENSANDFVVGTVITSDVDANDSFTYGITASDPAAAFAIGSTSGEITVSDSSLLDFETTPTFTLTVAVTDSGNLSDTGTYIIDLSDVNEAPSVDTATFNVDENSPNGTNVGTPVNATDPENDTITFSITGGDPDNVFDIDPNSGQITVADSSFLDFEAQGATPHYSLTVQASDGSLNGTAVININVNDVNEAPTVDPNTFNVDENSPNGTNVGTVTASDPESDALTFSITAGDPDNVFDIDPDTGVITVADNTFLDFEAFGATPHFSLTVQVVENATTDAFADTATIEINVNDVNESPTVNDNSFSINENSSNTTLVGTVTASDPDAADDGTLLFDILSGDPNGAFSISNDGSNNGQLRVADSNQLDYETTQSFSLSIVVTDHLNLENTANVTVTINNLFDEAPTVNNATFTVAQDSNDGVVVGTVSATDPEFASGDELTFVITGGNTGTVFAINSSTGQITVPDTSILDADTMPTFNLTVRATDKGGQIDTGIITINVSPLPITYIYLPVALNNYPPIEPNNNCSQAYSIGSGADYEFTADDVEDWYAITLTSAGNLTVILSSFEPAQGQLIVYGGTCNNLTLLGNNGNPNTPDKTLNLGVRPAGTYYIRVYSQPVTNTPYTLRVNVN